MDLMLGILYLVFIFPFYYLVGNMVMEYIKLKKTSMSKVIVTGFLSLKFIQWCIGFPCQFFHLSWNIYFGIMLILNAFLFIYSIRRYRSKLNLKKETIKVCIKDNLKTYWFIYLLVGVFSIWSMTSQLPYYLMNYDDHYYLGAMIQQAGSSALSVENFFNGAPMDVSFTRLINTFEIDYSFWAQLFHIYPIFFARCIMVIHNYLIVFLTYHAFFRIFKIQEKSYVQFMLIPMLILLIPAGFLADLNILRLYDGWQMNTAIWYGGSIVRLTCLPVLIMFAFEITKKITFKKLIFVGVLMCAYISFSSIAFPFIIIGLIIGWMLLAYRVFIFTDKKRILMSIGMLIILFLALKIGPKIFEMIIPGQSEKMVDAITSYRSMMSYYINENYLYMLTSSCILFNLINKKNKEFVITGLCVLTVIFICYSNLFDKFLIIISLKYDFVALRLITGLQMLLLAFLGYYILTFIKYFSKNFVPVSLISLSCVFLVNVFNIYHLDDYKDEKYNYAGTGISIFGYSFSRLVQNKEMAPNIYKDLYTYFSNEDKGRHRIINPKVIHYEDGNLFIYAGMGFSANNVQACITDEHERCDDMDNGIVTKLSDYTLGLYGYDDVKSLLDKYEIEYVLTTSETVKDELVQNGYICEMESVSLYGDMLYLVKL